MNEPKSPTENVPNKPTYWLKMTRKKGSEKNSDREKAKFMTY